MSEAAHRRLSRILEETDDADEALSRLVAVLADEPGIEWACVAFLDDGSLTFGPAAGSPDDARRTRVPIAFAGDPVGELLVDGAPDRAFLDQVAELIAPQVLIGWDTGGERWEP